MNRTLQSCCLAAIVLSLVFTSCRRADPVISTPTTVKDRTKLNKLFAPFRYMAQYFSVEAGTTSIIYGEKGTKLVFYPNSFKDAGGNTITGGFLNIYLIEMYKPGDMIANRATTTCEDQLLQSGGQVYISATKDGNEVFANKYGIGFKQDAPSSQQMQLFYGNTNNADSVATWTRPNSNVDSFWGTWANGTRSDTMSKPGQPLSVSIYYMFDSCSNFRFVNCDFFYNNPAPKVSVNVVMPDTSFNMFNTSVYIVFPSVNAVSQAGNYHYYSGTGDPRYFTANNFPEGMAIKIVVIARKNDDFYYYEQSGLSTSKDMVIPTTLSKQTREFVTTKLKAL